MWPFKRKKVEPANVPLAKTEEGSVREYEIGDQVHFPVDGTEDCHVFALGEIKACKKFKSGWYYLIIAYPYNPNDIKLIEVEELYLYLKEKRQDLQTVKPT